MNYEGIACTKDTDSRIKAFADAYLDYFNNYLTVACFAEHYGCEPDQAADLIAKGRICQELRAESYSATKEGVKP